MTIGDFKGRHVGGSCVIMANGPSLPTYARMARLKPHLKVVGLNRSWERRWPDYHIALDPQHRKENPDVYERLNADHRLFVYRSASWPYGISMRPLPGGTERVKTPFSFDLERGVVESLQLPTGEIVGSVAYLALQLVVWMGFTEVYFLGLDLGGPHFYDSRESPLLPMQDYLFRVAAKELDGKVKVYVCGSAHSSCTAFPKVGLEEVLA